MHRGHPGRCGFGKFGELFGFLLDPALEFRGRGTRRILQSIDELRDDGSQIADQWNIDRAVDPDGRRILLDEDPVAVRFVRDPVPTTSEMDGLAEFGADGETQVGVHDGIDGCCRETVREGAVLEAFDEGCAAGRLDDRACHEVGEFLDGRARLEVCTP